MAPDTFKAIFATLHNLDLSELEEAGVINSGANGGSDWTRFNKDIGTFVLKLPQPRLERLVALVESRTSTFEVALHRPASLQGKAA